MSEEECVYEVTDAVPIPGPRPRLNYPYEQLQVGESFWVGELVMQKLCNANNRQGK